MSSSSAIRLPENWGSSKKRFLPTKILLRDDNSLTSLQDAKQLASALSISLTTARILMGRGIQTVEQGTQFLNPTFKEHLPDPSRVKNIEAAATLLLENIEQKKQITVYSDFDVDGLSGGAQLSLYIQALGGRVITYSPNRFSEGYGLVKSAVEKLYRAKTDLLITVDCGINDHDAIALAKRFGLQVIVFDHHLPHCLPPADVIVNPGQGGCPFEEYHLASAGLIWLFLVVLRRMASSRFESGKDQETELTCLPDPKEFLDLAALGTICDMVPLTGVNRLIARRGLEAISQSKRTGIVALKEVSKINGTRQLTAGHVGFGLGPRINAAGRLEDAELVWELLTTTNGAKAKSIASTLDRLNSKRRVIQDQVFARCLGIVRERGDQAYTKPALMFFSEDFHVGVIGIVAQRLVEEFHRPVAVMAPGEVQIGRELKLIVKGSVRGVAGFHVAFVLQSLHEQLISGGGHAAAGGFSVLLENRETFEEAFIAAAKNCFGDKMHRREKMADVEVLLGEIDYALVQELGQLSPFGIGNPAPLFVTRKVTLEALTMLSNGHLRLRVREKGITCNAVAWGFQGHPLMRQGRCVDIAYHPEINSYQGIASVQLNIREVWDGEN